MFYTNIRIEFPYGFGSAVTLRDGGTMACGEQWTRPIVAAVICRTAEEAADWGLCPEWAESLFDKNFLVGVIDPDDESGHDFIITDPAWAVLTPATVN